MKKAQPDLFDVKVHPQSYGNPAKKQGKIIRIEYDSYNYAFHVDEKIKKPANVYIPYGYDENDKNRKYNVFYMMHGWTDNADFIFGKFGKGTYFKNVLDNMIENNDIPPLIIVTPTYEVYNREGLDFGPSCIELKAFHYELENDLVPAVETQFNTYAKSGRKEDLIESRDHRAFGGFSLGGVTTWYSFIFNLDYFKYYIPMSGDCWILGTFSGLYRPKETVDYLIKHAQMNAKYDFFIFAFIGSQDGVFQQVNNQMQEMLQRPEFTPDRFKYKILKGAVHDFYAVLNFLYNALGYIFHE